MTLVKLSSKILLPFLFLTLALPVSASDQGTTTVDCGIDELFARLPMDAKLDAQAEIDGINTGRGGAILCPDAVRASGYWEKRAELIEQYKAELLQAKEDNQTVAAPSETVALSEGSQPIQSTSQQLQEPVEQVTSQSATSGRVLPKTSDSISLLSLVGGCLIGFGAFKIKKYRNMAAG